MANLPDIVIPHHNRWDLIGGCLRSIPMEYKVFIIRGNTFAISCNKGASLSKAEKLLFLNDDVILTKQVLNELQQHDEDIVGVPLRIPNLGKIVYGMNMYWGKYGNVNTLLESIKTQLSFNNTEDCQIPSTGAAFMIKRKVFENLGKLNDEYKNGGEDNELFLKALEKGYSFGRIDSICDHFHSSSSGRYDNDIFNHKLLTKNFPKHRLLKILKKKNIPEVLISVIIPTKKTVGEPACIESLKKQSYKNIEIIIIRDKDKKGASWARNQGKEKAKGEYLFFCDDDITLKPIMLELLLVKLRYSNASFSYCNYYRTGELTGQVKSMPWDVNSLKNQNYISTMSLIKTKDFPEQGFDETLERFQDWDLWLSMAEQGKSGLYINETLFTAHYEAGGISCNVSNLTETMQIVKNKHLNFILNKKSMAIFSNNIIKRPISGQKEVVTKHNRKKIKLEFGGKNPIHLQGDWEHLDTQAFPHTEYITKSFNELPFEDNSVDEIFTKDLIQKFSKDTFPNILKEWQRVLKPSGKITFVCVNIKEAMGRYLQTYEKKYLSYIFGTQEDKSEQYVYGYTIESLSSLLTEVGFINVQRIMPQVDYYNPAVDFIMEAKKTNEN